jgi:hypothetical protein
MVDMTQKAAMVRIGDIYGVKEALQALQQIAPDLAKELRKRAVDSARHIEVQISLDRPTVADVGSGWAHRGRTAIDAPLEFKRKFGGRIHKDGRKSPLLKIQVLTPGIAIAEFAGDTGIYNRKPRSRAYRGRPQGHALNDQGRFMAARLSAGGREPGRYIWPAAEKALPAAQAEAFKAVQDVMEAANMNMVVR